VHCQKDTCDSFQLPIILHATVKWFILQELAQASQRSAWREGGGGGSGMAVG